LALGRVGRQKAFVRKLLFLFAFNLVLLDSAGAGTHVAIVKGRPLPPYEEAIQGIREGLLQSDSSLDVDVHDFEGRFDQTEAIVEQLRKDGTKLVIAVGTEAAQALRNEVGDLPLVMAMVYDPVGEGLADEQHHYGAYLKVSFDREFSILKKIMPGWKTLALVRRKGTKTALVEEAGQAAERSGLKLVVLELESLDQLSSTLEEASHKSDALLMILDQEIYNTSTAKELLLFSARKKYPIIALSSNYVQAGALMSVSSDFRSNGLTAGKLAARLLKNETSKPHFMPTEKLKTVWNKRIAGVFGIAAPADEGQVDETY
jgi:putative ABC transport system substrate-binding protein